MKRLVVLLPLVALALTGNASADNPPTKHPVKVDSGYVWTIMDSSGNVLEVRQHDGIPEGQNVGSDDAQAQITYRRPGVTGNTRPLGRASTFRLFACCSSSGCDQVDRYESGHSAFGSLLFRFHMVVYWCWSYPRITGVNVGTYVSDVQGCCVRYNGLSSAYGWYYSWGGSDHGGHYSYRQGSFSNCVLRYGCLGDAYPWVETWVNGNGAWKSDDGGGPTSWFS